MKKIQEYLKDLKPEHKELALTNIGEQGMVRMASSLSDALHKAFIRDCSPEEGSLVCEIYEYIIRGTYQPQI